MSERAREGNGIAVLIEKIAVSGPTDEVVSTVSDRPRGAGPTSPLQPDEGQRLRFNGVLISLRCSSMPEFASLSSGAM